jgi:histidinol-phosphate aminotransferase
MQTEAAFSAQNTGYDFHPGLLSSSTRIRKELHAVTHRLDKNEQPDDVDLITKYAVFEHLSAIPWNRYPAADTGTIEALIAQYCGVEPARVVAAPGSASIITALLNYLALNGRAIHICQPTYSLFDYHCKTYNIPYTPWLLTPELRFNMQCLPELENGSVLFVVSPNNPTGTVLSNEDLATLCEVNPSSLIIMDSVYYEFGNVDYMQLLEKYPNLVILRSFSKAFPVAGLRLGYLCASAALAVSFRKLMLPFSLNPFVLSFAEKVLFRPDFQKAGAGDIRHLTQSREMLQQVFSSPFFAGRLTVFPSGGNFLLIKTKNRLDFESIMTGFQEHGVAVLDTSTCPNLDSSFRLTIGSPTENALVVRILKKTLEKSSPFC